MSRTPRLLCSLALAVAGAAVPAAAQVALAELPGLARERAEKQRPAQEKKLEPFWADLQLDYANNEQHLDKKIAQVAELGDSVVPLLLERLNPQTNTPAARATAANCRRVLERLDPSSFLDALVELVNSGNAIARTEALRLLGHTKSSRAVEVLVDFLGRATGEDRLAVLRSLKLLKAPEAAMAVAGLLGNDDRALRESALEYLVAAKPEKAIGIVIQALGVEKYQRLLPLYVEYFGAVAKEHEAATLALLPLMDGSKLDWRDTYRLVELLATIAPKDHAATTRKLTDLIDAGETGQLGLRAALTLRALGDKQGLTKLKNNLNDQLDRPQRKREAGLWELRGNLYFATEDWGRAVADYEKMLQYVESSVRMRAAQFHLARAEAKRHGWAKVVKYLKDASATAEEIEADPVLMEAVNENERVRAFVVSLRSGGEPKK